MATAIATEPVSQVIAALLVGLLIAFGFQLLLTIFGLGLGLSVWGFQPHKESKSESEKTDTSTKDSASSESIVNKISIAAGFSVLLTINTVLFVACFLAIAFCSVNDSMSGAILGVTIWSAYFSIAIWLGSKATTSVLGFVLSSAISGFSKIISTLSALIGKSFNSSSVPLTEEAAKVLIGQEIQTSLDALDIRKAIEEYVEKIPQPQANFEAIKPEFRQFLQNLNPEIFASAQLLAQIDRQNLAKSIADRTNLSTEDAEQLVQEFVTAWQQKSKNPQPNLNDAFIDYLRSLDPENLNLDTLWERLEPIAQSSSQTNLNKSVTEDNLEQKNQENSLLTKVRQLSPSLEKLDFHEVKSILLERLDLTELDIEKILKQLYPFFADLFTEDKKDSASLTSYNVIQTDVEDYLLHVFPWRMNSDTMKQEFRDVLWDREASPEQVKLQIEQLQQDNFVTILNQREDLRSEQVEAIAARLEAVRLDVLNSLSISAVKKAEISKVIAELEHKLESYLHYTSLSQIVPEGIESKLQKLIEEAQISPQLLQQEIPQFNRDKLNRILQRRKKLKASKRKKILHQIQHSWSHLLKQLSEIPQSTQESVTVQPPRRWAKRTKHITRNFWSNLTDYLLYADLDNLSLEAIEQNLKWLLKTSSFNLKPTKEIAVDLMQNLAQLDRTTALQILSKRQDLTSTQIQQIGDRLDSVRQQLLQQARGNLDRLVDTIELFFSNLEFSRLDATSVKEDLQALFANPPAQLVDLTRPISLLLANKSLNLEQLGDYLGYLSQEALKTVFQARQDISERLAQPLQEQVEGIREWVKQKVDTIQEDIENRSESLKQKTLKQLEETRKAIATAIWWLFAIAFSSVLTSAFAGIIAVKGINFSFLTNFWSKFI